MDSTKQFRIQAGLRQKELAGLLGISRIFLAQVETGRSGLPTETLVRFSRLKKIWTDLPEGTEIKEDYLKNKSEEKNDAARIRILHQEIKKLEFKVGILTNPIMQLQKGLLFCKELQLSNWAEGNRDTSLALDMVQVRHQIQWSEKGPKALAKLQFYLRQKKEELQFLEDFQGLFQIKPV